MPFMIIREKDINHLSNEIKIITISCEEVIEKQIIPELSLIYTLKINEYEDFIKYISLIESVIKSAAIVQQLCEIKYYLQIENPSKEFIHEIQQLRNEVQFETKYNGIFELYYPDQSQINMYLITAKSLFSHRTFISDLEYIIKLAHKGMIYTTHVVRYELPATYYCYTKQFNQQLSEFLQNIIEDQCDQYNKTLYNKYASVPISKEAFSSVITTLAFRLQLAVRFIESFYINQQLIEEKQSPKNHSDIDHYFLQFVGEVRSRIT
jgi:hypothetical protein